MKLFSVNVMLAFLAISSWADPSQPGARLTSPAVVEYLDAKVILELNRTAQTYRVVKVEPIDSAIFHRTPGAKYHPGFLGEVIPDAKVRPWNFAGPFYLSGTNSTVNVFLLKTTDGNDYHFTLSHEVPETYLRGTAPFDLHSAFSLIDRHVGRVRLGEYEESGSTTLAIAKAEGQGWVVDYTTGLVNCFDMCMPGPDGRKRTIRIASQGSRYSVCYVDSLQRAPQTASKEKCFYGASSIRAIAGQGVRAWASPWTRYDLLGKSRSEGVRGRLAKGR